MREMPDPHPYEYCVFCGAKGWQTREFGLVPVYIGNLLAFFLCQSCRVKSIGRARTLPARPLNPRGVTG